MKSLLIEIDDDVAVQLEKFAPARSRRRSEFVRAAIRKALWDLVERVTREAYERDPDTDDDVHFDPSVWELASGTKHGRKRRG